MKIGISTSVIQRGKSGIAQHVFALTRALKKFADQHQFVLFVLEDDMPLFEGVSDRMAMVKVSERFRPPLRNIFWHQTALPRLIRDQRIDVLHVPSYRRLLWRHPSGLVGTVHDLAPFRVAGKYDRCRMIYGRRIVKWLARRQDALITVSRSTARDVAEFWGRTDGVTVIPNAVDHERFCMSKDVNLVRFEIARRHNLDAPFFLYVARLEHPGKNHLRLIEAFERFKAKTGSNWKLVLAGGDWHGAENIHAAIRQSADAADIRCLGFVPDTELPDLYRAARVFVYPSLHEGFGMPPLEAMACGCPVISSPAGSLEEVVGSAGVLIDPHDVEAWSNQMTRLAHDPGACEQLRSAGLARARCFSWEKTAEATLAVYHGAAALADPERAAAPRWKTSVSTAVRSFEP